jgi:uncharacterized membrane protein HdeD (DUF308 family)
MLNSTPLIVRGILGVLVGLSAMVWPGITLLAFVTLFAVYAAIDGVANLLFAFGRPSVTDRRWLHVALGVLSLAAAAIAIMRPGITLVTLVLFIAAWAVIRGVLELALAFRLRKVITGEWLMALAGIGSIVFGLAVFAFPAAGAVSIAWLLGAYAAAWGVVLIGLGIRLRSLTPA